MRFPQVSLTIWVRRAESEDVSQILPGQTRMKSFLLGKVFLRLNVKGVGMKVSK